MTPTEAIGLFCAGSLVTLVALLSLAWSRMTGFRIEVAGLRLVDGDQSELDRVKAHLDTMTDGYGQMERERDAARAGMDQLEAALREVKGL